MEGTYGYCIMLNVHTCTYIHGLHTYTPIHIYMYICVHIYVWVYIYMCVCVHIYTYMYSWASGRTAAHHPWACLCRRGYACTHTNLHVYTHTPTYMLCSVLQWVVAVATHRAQLAVIRMPRPVRPNARYIYSLAGWQASCSTNYCILHMAKSDSYNIHNYIALYACCVLHTLFYIQTTCLMECKVVTTCSHGSASFHSVCWTYQVVSK